MRQIPNLLTLGNLLCGLLAIIFTLHAPAFIATYSGNDFLVTAPPPIYWASVLIGIAVIFDFLDGFTARLLHVDSPMGVQLDSLADLVTFGLAPAMIMYQLINRAVMQKPDALEMTVFIAIPALLIPCCAAFRLARFNISTDQHSYFKGMPTPAVGLAIASFPLIVFYNQAPFDTWLLQIGVLHAFAILACILMVCNIPFFNLKIKSLAWKGNELRYLLVILTLISIPFLYWAAVPFCFLLYFVLSIGKFWFAPEGRFRKKNVGLPQIESE